MCVCVRVGAAEIRGCCFPEQWVEFPPPGFTLEFLARQWWHSELAPPTGAVRMGLGRGVGFRSFCKAPLVVPILKIRLRTTSWVQSPHPASYERLGWGQGRLCQGSCMNKGWPEMDDLCAKLKKRMASGGVEVPTCTQKNTTEWRGMPSLP